jgi:hypothetical protein
MSDPRAVRKDCVKGWELPGDCAPISFSEHACRRYGERIKPALDEGAIRRELSQLLATATVTRTAPSWYRPIPGKHRPVAAYLVAGSVVMPLCDDGDGELRAVTTVAPGTVSEPGLELRRARERRRRSGRAAARVARKRTKGGRDRGAVSIDLDEALGEADEA